MNLTRDLIFLVIYILGMSGILYWRKRQSDPALFFYCGTWTFMMMVTYFVVLEVFYHTFYFLIPLLFFSIFAFFYFKEKRRLINGVLFNTFLIVFGGYLGWLLIETQNIFIGGLLALIGIPILILLAIGIYILIIFFILEWCCSHEKRIPFFGQSFDPLVRSRFDYLFDIGLYISPLAPTMGKCSICCHSVYFCLSTHRFL